MADCRLTLTVRPVADAAEREAAMALRVRVFCDEQGVDHSEELDEHDATALQLVALDESGVVATCRLRPVGRDTKLERMAVERRMRGSGVGGRLLAEAESLARDQGSPRMVLNAQVRARDFYAGSGYEAEGDTFMEAGIEHVRMAKDL